MIAIASSLALKYMTIKKLTELFTVTGMLIEVMLQHVHDTYTVYSFTSHFFSFSKKCCYYFNQTILKQNCNLKYCLS